MIPATVGRGLLATASPTIEATPEIANLGTPSRSGWSLSPENPRNISPLSPPELKLDATSSAAKDEAKVVIEITHSIFALISDSTSTRFSSSWASRITVVRECRCVGMSSHPINFTNMQMYKDR